MKRFIINFVIVFLSLSANAQYTPQKGDFSTVIKFNPFHNSGKTFEAVDDYSIQGRYMVSDKDGIRLILGIGYNDDSLGSDSDLLSIYNINNVSVFDGTYSNTNIGFKLGYERHFRANDRIDLYVGAQIGYKVLNTTISFYADVTNKNLNDQSAVSHHMIADNVKGGVNEFNVGAFTGINFYVYKRLFAGAEIGFNYAHTSNKNLESDLNFDYLSASPSKIKVTSNKLGFKVEPQLSLGWTF